MLARLHVLLPFALMIPDGEQFQIFEYVDDGYRIRIYPPQVSDQPTGRHDFDELRVGTTPVIQANALQIDFLKENFQREENGECDPPYVLINRSINAFLLKLRFVTRGSQIRTVDFPLVSWHLEYLNDDESALKKKKGLVRGRGGRKYEVRWIALTKEIWEDLNKLGTEFVPPEWDSLLLDAHEALPEIGPSVVLAATALEVFVAHILNAMAEKSTVPKELWNWINNRAWWLKEPDSKEQFDTLLRVLLGVSLKDNNELWGALCNLRDARNSFVHEGVARIGKARVPLSTDDARKLIGKANEIVKFVKEKLPAELQWPEFKYSVQITATKKLIGD